MSAGPGPEISAIRDQIESHEKSIRTLPAKFEAEVKGIADRITKKIIEVDTELFSQRQHHQLEDQALQAQEAQIMQEQVDAVLAQHYRLSRLHLEIAHPQK
jgi:Na+-transporting NADH:ubiquinone oxidoreductase subunit NqrC